MHSAVWPGPCGHRPVLTGAEASGGPAEAYTVEPLPKCLTDPKTERAKGWETGQTFPFFHCSFLRGDLG